MDKVKVVGVTDPIPNDTVSVRKGLPEAVVTLDYQAEDVKTRRVDTELIDYVRDAVDKCNDPNLGAVTPEIEGDRWEHSGCRASGGWRRSWCRARWG